MPSDHASVLQRAEIQLLCCCAPKTQGTDTPARIKHLAAQPIDWELLIRLSRLHGTLPLLYRNLNSICPEALPAGVLDQLREAFHANARHNLMLMGELIKLLNSFETRQILAIPFKGPILTSQVYGDLALRVFGDLDILVHKEDWKAATELLASAGYRPRNGLSTKQEHLQQDSAHAVTFARADGAFNVDLHWRIAQSHFAFAISPETLWDRSANLTFGGRSVRNLDIDDLLLILSIHGARHCWERLGWLCDVAEIVNGNFTIAWDILLERADALRSRRVLLLSLRLAHQLLDAQLPGHIFAEFAKDRKLNGVARRLAEHMFTEEPELIREVKRITLYFRMREDLTHKLPYFFYSLRKTLTPNAMDKSVLPMPSILAPLYYVFRPLRLFTSYAWSGLKYFYSRHNAA